MFCGSGESLLILLIYRTPLPVQLRFRFVWDKIMQRVRHALDRIGLAWVIDTKEVVDRLKTIWLNAREPLKLGASIAFVLWLGTAEVLYFWVQCDPHNCIGLTDLAFPWRWNQIRDLRGQGYIAEGLEALEAGRINDGLFQIRQGLARHPDDSAVRLAVARLYAQAGYYAGVREIMLPQLTLSPPPRKSIRFLVAAAQQSDDDATVLAACDCTLVAGGLAVAERGWLLEQKAQALITLGKPADALVALDEAGRERSIDWRRLRVNALFGTGRAAEAVAEIRAWPAGGVPEEFRLQLLAAACRRTGQPEKMAAALQELQRSRSTEIEPWIVTIEQYVQAGWGDAAWNELQECLRRFDADAAAVARIEQTCVEAGAPDLVALCVENARELGRPLIPLLGDLALTQLRAGDAAAAERTFEHLLEEDRKARDHVLGFTEELLKSAPGSRDFGGGFGGTVPSAPGAAAGLSLATRDFLRTLLDAVVQPARDRAEAHCGVLLRGNFRLAAFTGGAEVLAKFGHWQAVAAVARVGLTQFPGSTQLTRWSTAAAEKVKALASPAATGPLVSKSAAPLARQHTVPPPLSDADMSEGDFFSKLDDAARRRAWSEVATMIHAARVTAPQWLPQVEAELAWREVRVAFEQDDRPQLLYLISQRLRTRKGEGGRALEFARWYCDRGELEIARLLAKRILQEVPSYVAGRNFLVELDKAVETQGLPARAPRQK